MKNRISKNSNSKRLIKGRKPIPSADQIPLKKPPTLIPTPKKKPNPHGTVKKKPQRPDPTKPEDIQPKLPLVVPDLNKEEKERKRKLLEQHRENKNKSKPSGAVKGSKEEPINEFLLYDADSKNIVRSDFSTLRKGVSIMISAYKTERFIEECLDSIERQTYFKDNDMFEVLVGVDGCTPTLEKLKSIKDKYRNLKIVMMAENAGTYQTTNALINLTQYENIIRFDSDDIMKPNMIQKILEISDNFDIIRFKFTSFKDNVGNILKKESGRICAVGVIFIKKDVFRMCGGYENYRFSADSELLKRVEKFVKIYHMPDELFYYRIHSSSLSFSVPQHDRRVVNQKFNNKVYTQADVKINPVCNRIKEII